MTIGIVARRLSFSENVASIFCFFFKATIFLVHIFVAKGLNEDEKKLEKRKTSLPSRRKI